MADVAASRAVCSSADRNVPHGEAGFGERRDDCCLRATNRMGDMASGKHADDRNDNHEPERQPQNRPAEEQRLLAGGLALARSSAPRGRFRAAARSGGGFSFHLSHEASSRIHRTSARKLMSL